MTVRARWTGSIGRRLSVDEEAARWATIERLLGVVKTDLARLHGELALSFRQMLRNFSDPAALDRDAAWAAKAMATAHAVGQPDLVSAAYDAAGAVELGRDELRRVLDLQIERLRFEDRVSTGERADAWIVHTWAELLLGKLEEAVESAERARAGLVSGQASSFMLGSTSWRVVALQSLGRWDEALVDAGRAERAWQESELRAPWYALNGFLAAFAIARARGDVVGADHWKSLIAKIDEGSDSEVRTRRLFAYANDDLDKLASDVIRDHRTFSGRYDYVGLSLALLADRRHHVPSEWLDTLLDHVESRGLDWVAAHAHRLRGLIAGDVQELRGALASFESMRARPYVARLRSEVGRLTGDAAMIEQGLDELEQLGDVEHSARVAAERAAIASA